MSKIRTGNCRHCLRDRAVGGGLCHRERRRWSWRRPRRRSRRRPSWRWRHHGGGHHGGGGHHFGGRHHGGGHFHGRAAHFRSFSGHRSFSARGRSRTSFVLRATHEFRWERPGAELARTRPQLSPHRSAASSRDAGQRYRGRGACRVAIRTVAEAAAGGGTAMAATAGSDRCSGRSPISTSTTTRCGDRVSARRSGTTAMTIFMPACSAPMTIRVLRATCRRAVRPAPGRTGWRCCAARTAAKSPACRST